MKKILVVFFTLVLLGIACQAQAQSKFNIYNTPDEYSKNSQVADGDNILIILDCSYSMRDKVHNRRKIDIAREVINRVLGEMSSNLKIGLRVYGHKRGFLGMNDCRISELMVPISLNSRHKISNVLSQLEPTGWTPIIYSIDSAINEDFIGLRGKRRIILVSDGMETCDGSPCSYAVDLVKNNVDITIDVIGFDLQSDPSAISQLKCTAVSTRGKFYTADNPEEFMKSFQQSIYSSKKVSGQVIQAE